MVIFQHLEEGGEGLLIEALKGTLPPQFRYKVLSMGMTKLFPSLQTFLLHRCCRYKIAYPTHLLHNTILLHFDQHGQDLTFIFPQSPFQRPKNPV